MTAAEIDRYLADLDEARRAALEQLRRKVLSVVPEAEQSISYGLPAFRVNGKIVAGFAAFKKHLTYLPHSGSTLNSLEGDLDGYDRTKGSLHFPVDQPLPLALVTKLVMTRLNELGPAA
ncbi:MAG: DUF1801 domain-containing protein [Actinomycetota bacterium]|nr:DUF1801 domain-containing protein [Actinomycetota bacterium]